MLYFFNKAGQQYEIGTSIAISPSRYESYGHYTNWDSFSCIAGQKYVEGVGMKWLFKFSDVRKLNDTEEGRAACERPIYVMCLSCSQCENIAMWNNYAIPRSQAICMRMSKQVIRRILDSIESDGIYIRSGNNERLHRVRLSKKQYRLFKITYLSEKNLVSTDKNSVAHEEQFKAPPWYDEEIVQYLVKKTEGWSYENEARIVVWLDGQYDSNLEVFADFAPFFEALEVNGKTENSLIAGPNTDAQVIRNVYGHQPGNNYIAFIKNSQYHRQIRFLTPCKWHNEKKKDCPEKCNCSHKVDL